MFTTRTSNEKLTPAQGLKFGKPAAAGLHLGDDLGLLGGREPRRRGRAVDDDHAERDAAHQVVAGADGARGARLAGRWLGCAGASRHVPQLAVARPGGLVSGLAAQAHGFDTEPLRLGQLLEYGLGDFGRRGYSPRTHARRAGPDFDAVSESQQHPRLLALPLCRRSRPLGDSGAWRGERTDRFMDDENLIEPQVLCHRYLRSESRVFSHASDMKPAPRPNGPAVDARQLRG